MCFKKITMVWFTKKIYINYIVDPESHIPILKIKSIFRCLNKEFEEKYSWRRRKFRTKYALLFIIK